MKRFCDNIGVCTKLVFTEVEARSSSYVAVIDDTNDTFVAVSDFSDYNSYKVTHHNAFLLNILNVLGGIKVCVLDGNLTDEMITLVSKCCYEQNIPGSV